MRKYSIIITPFPAFPQGGRSTKPSFPPWGKQERGYICPKCVEI